MGRVTRLHPSTLPLVGAVVCVFSLPATAQPTGVPPAGQERVRVTYRAPDTCPSEAEFLERVRSRVQRARFAEPGELARAFTVTIGRTDGDAGFSGRLEFVDSDGLRAARTLKGKACDDLASSLALITALAVDDRIAEAPLDAVSTEPSPPPEEQRAPTKKTKPEPTAPPRLPEPADRVPQSVKPWRWELGANAGVLSWVTASPAPMLGLYAELGSRIPSWSVRLSALDARRSKTDPGLGSADFAADFLRLEACPVALALGAHFSLSPCLGFDAGRLRGKADTADAQAQDLFWAAGLALARMSWVFRERLVLGWDGELGVPFVHERYEFQNPNGRVLEVPKIGLGAKFGVGVRFP